ncbi:MAG TPA: 2-oxoacid:acceptor oxidoreductase subunit alpha [bacterium]|nr:2-oxoacid:acceptor oxidoreductase subunit alpha [bacterium]
MRKIDLTIEICGSSGDGTLAAGDILAMTLSHLGYHTLSFDVYPAEIRGFGKCVAHTRVSDAPLYSVGRGVDVLVSLNDPYSIEQAPSLKERAVVLFDSWPLKEVGEGECVAGHLKPGNYLYGVPMGELSQRSTHGWRSRNIVALGALAGLFDMDVDGFLERLTSKFKKKAGVAEQVAAAFKAGVDYVRENLLKIDPLSLALDKKPEQKGYALLSGNEAAAQGALDAKCRFYAGYPITPATKIMEILSARLPREGGTVVQTEDEISAIGMVTGAAFMGKRAMTATSGPGLCLMSEFIGYNVMAENSVVILDGQRGGPATGLPTKTEQSDLMMAMFGTNGDAPRIVVAPTSVAECHYWVAEAFYLAEKYQVPVIVLSDLFLATCKTNVILAKIDPKKLAANKVPTAEQMKDYRRQLVTDDGVSPRTIPGTVGGEFVVSGLEQDEEGTPAYDAKTHTMMTEKRHRKMRTALENDVPRPERFGCNGKASLGVLSWGSTMGAVVEAVERACEKGHKVAALKQVVLNPLHVEDLKAFCADCETLLVPELNYGGQFANWLSMHVSAPMRRLCRVNTRPLSYQDVLEEIENISGDGK